jgi:DNA-binding MarR family transcriptional regulator
MPWQEIQQIDAMNARKIENRPSSDATALAEELRRAIGTLVRVIREKTATEKSAQSETLGLLEREGAMNVAVLAQRRKVTHQSMRVVVAQLVADGLVERSPDPGDRRSWLLSLSHTGRARVRRDRDVRVARIAGLVETTLSAAEQKRLRASIGLLDRISAAAKD